MKVEELKNNPNTMLVEINNALKSNEVLDTDKILAIKAAKSSILKVDKSIIRAQIDEMYSSGNYVDAIKMLFDTGLATSLFKKKREFDDEIKLLAEDIKSIADFYSIICYNDHDAYKKVFNGSIDIAKGIKAIGSVFIGISEMGMNLTDEGRYRLIGYDAMKISKSISESGVIPSFMQKAIASLDNKTYPKCPKDFPVKGVDLKSVKNIKDSEIQDVIQTMVIAVMLDKYPLDKEVLLEVYRRDLLKI